MGVTDPAKLFDIIDANGSGYLDIGELVDGLMRLRGPSDKGDAVGALMSVRSLQRDIKKLEVDLLRSHNNLHRGQKQLLSALADIPRKCGRQAVEQHASSKELAGESRGDKVPLTL